MRTKVILRWLLTNSLFGLALYFGLVKGVEGAANIAQFFIWFCFVVSLFSLSDDMVRAIRKRSGPSVPSWINATIDLCVIATLVWYGWTWTGCAYVVSAILIFRSRQPVTPAPPQASRWLWEDSDSHQKLMNSECMQGDQPVIRVALLLAHKQGLGARFWARSALPSIEEIEAELGPDLLKQARDLVDYRPSNFST